MKHNIPNQFFYRIHHVRPRFKSNVEEVLLFMANTIVSKGRLLSGDFKKFLNEEITKFPGNQNKTLKTIQNWRTEISALFSLYFDKGKYSIPSALAKDLGEDQDLTRFFKYFLFTFQYPGGHIKAKEVQNLIEQKILFHPTNYFLRVLQDLCNIAKKEGYLTKGEACHMIFNDLRATRDSKYKNTKNIAHRIFKNRKSHVEYDLSGDIIRYAGDILDYMTLANLLKSFGGKFYQNSSESKAIKKFISNKNYFLYKKPDLKKITLEEKCWVQYVSGYVDKKIFGTDILAFISEDEKEYKKLLERTAHIKKIKLRKGTSRVKDIGDYGESLVHGHECMFLKINDREDLINLVKCIPNHFAVGYDIQSVNLDETRKYIEVKSTISSKKLTFNRFKLTKNEIRSAQTLGENYFVYRLRISKQSGKNPMTELTIIKNPIKLFKENKINLDLVNGDVNLGIYQGEEQELLFWKHET